MYVKEIMKGKLVTVDCNETIKSACDKYREFKVGCLVVTEKDRVAGMVTERDFIERTICMERDPKTTKIKEIMSSEVKTVDSYDSIGKALGIIKKYNIKKLPVVSNNKLVGIITITDIAYARPSVKKFLETQKD